MLDEDHWDPVMCDCTRRKQVTGDGCVICKPDRHLDFGSSLDEDSLSYTEIKLDDSETNL